MKSIILAFILAVTSNVYAAASKTLWYEGVASITDLGTGNVKQQRLVLAKTLDADSGFLVEIACVEEDTSSTRLSAVYMKVDGHKLSISDSKGAPKYLSGTGEVMGEDWNWNYLKFSMNAGPVVIEDANFVVPGKLIARKQIFMKSTGLPVQLWETEMKEIPESQFQTLSRSMNCPQIEYH